jgi:RNA polymerase sigma-70 factor (ECF subfamily)
MHATTSDARRDEIVRSLVENYTRFLSFLERRVGSRDVAEDILQDAFVRGMRRAGNVRDTESATAWFYRVLRRAIADHWRRSGVEGRAREALAAASADHATPALDDEELWRESCSCVRDFLRTLKPEYARALERVDLDELPLRAYADEEGITPNNASVRLHRARQALRRQVKRSCETCAEHRCLECSCRRG